MKYLRTYEDFTDTTLNINNDEYNLYYDFYTGDTSKSLMWMTKGSQEKNFKMVAKYINEEDSVLDYGCGTGDFTKYLRNNDIEISKYLGVDINENFIEEAKELYPDYKFKVIDSMNDLKGNWDIVCAIGVFTWFISKKEFIEIINKLYDLCDKKLLLTLLKGETPYDNDDYTKKDEDKYWSKEYRFYNKKLFEELFPDFEISYDYDESTILVKIEKT